MGIDTQEQAEYWQAACKPDWVFTGRLIHKDEWYQAN